MSNDKFKSFLDIKKYVLSRKWAFEKTKEEVKRAIWIYVQWKVRERYKRWHLYKTWKLKNSVKYEILKNKVNIFTDMEWLAHIHEYWRTRKMTAKQRAYLFAVVFKNTKWKYWKSRWDWLIKIPPRPIWRIVLQNEKNRLQSLVDKYLDKYF